MFLKGRVARSAFQAAKFDAHLLDEGRAANMWTSNSPSAARALVPESQAEATAQSMTEIRPPSTATRPKVWAAVLDDGPQPIGRPPAGLSGRALP
jgi:hypothetical protein